MIPEIRYAIIGGSSTNSINFPRDLNNQDITILAEDIIYDTPFGKSPKFTLFQYKDKKVITVRMHGWRPNEVTRAVASQQLFWVLGQAGVKKIFAEGGVGSINRLLDLKDLVIADDYIDNSQRKDVGLGGPYLLMMRDPICPTQAKALFVSAQETVTDGRNIFQRGVYVNTDGRHFESRAEIQVYKGWGADIVGQSITPEVYLAREIGACYAGIYMVVNYAEGIIKDWEHQELKDIFYGESHTIGNILINALDKIDDNQESCNCANLRKNTLLKDK